MSLCHSTDGMMYYPCWASLAAQLVKNLPAAQLVKNLPAAQLVKNLPASAGDAGLIPGLGSYPGDGNGNPV